MARAPPEGRHQLPAAARGPLTWVREHIIVIAATLAFVYLLLPNVVVIIFSFNKPNGRLQLHVDPLLHRRLDEHLQRSQACASRWG